MELPPELRAAVDAELASLPAKKLAAIATDLSNRYRSGVSETKGRFVRSAEDVSAYAAFRLPATFGAVYAALRQVQERMPNFAPESVLDIGAGPGTAMWAAATVWPDIEKVTLIEQNEAMRSLGRRLASSSTQVSIREAHWMSGDVTKDWETDSADVVIASYVMNELQPEQRITVLTRLWALTRGVVVIVEPGTPVGFEGIRAIRQWLIQAGGKTVAPCPHDGLCPMKDDDWCHFTQRITRSRLHRQVKSADLSYEDEKFSFAAISRTSVAELMGRVVRHPQVRPGHIHLELCTPEGLKREVVTRKDKKQFRQARDLSWGSAVFGESD